MTRLPHPAAHPLARALLLALTALPLSPALAGELDGTEATVGEGDISENWTVRNGGVLNITNGGTAGVVKATANSRLNFDGASITWNTSDINQRAVVLQDDAHLEASNSNFIGGGVSVAVNASAHLVNSNIQIDANTAARSSIGLNFASVLYAGAINPQITLEGTRVHVEDAIDASSDWSGRGIVQAFGQMNVLNGSQVYGANSAAYLLMEGGSLDSSTGSLRVDNSTLQSGRGPAIYVGMSRPDGYDFTVDVANNAKLISGDGNLLLVKSNTGSFIRPGIATVRFNVDDSRLIGDVTYDRSNPDHADGILDVTLRNKAQIDGRMRGVSSASIGTDATWLLTGDSDVGRLQLDATGTVGLGNGSTFNTLTVGEFIGNGGTLQFNSVLGDDASATDKLIITGDSSGQANVRVLNAGGAGAQTDKGIELIRVDGASNGQFDLQGRAVGGQYEYFLVKDSTNGGWYLRSQLQTTPDPCDTDPTLPGCTPIDPIDPVDPIDPIDPPPPVLRPETGAYLANQFALGQMLRHTWRDRLGGYGTADEGVRGWAQVSGTQSRLGAVDDQLDLTVERSRLQLGADLGVFDGGRGRVGVMGTAAQSSATSRSQLTGYSATGKLKGGAVGAYGNWSNDRFHVDASAQRGRFRNTVQGEGLAAERYDSNLWQSSLEAGYVFGLGQIGSTAISVQPELQLVYTDASTEVHEEANGTVVRSQGESGLSGRVGLRLQGQGSATAGAAVSPYLAANWYRDGAVNGIAFDNDVMKASTPRDRYELSAGARVQFRSGLNAWGGLGVTRGDHGYREATANVSVSYAW